MVVKFNNEYLEKLVKGEKVRGKPKYNDHVIKKFKKTLLILKNMPTTSGLASLNSLNFEALKGNLNGFYSVRIDYHYRLIFSIEKDKVLLNEIVYVEDLTNHYQ